MGRKRKEPHDARLPDYVYRGRCKYEYRPYAGKGQKRKAIPLCPLDAPLAEVWAAWARHQQGPTDTLGWLLDEYLASPQFVHMGDRPKSKKTITEQRRQAAAIKAYKLKGGRRFGEVRRRDITPGVMRRYLDARLEDGAPVAGNREFALISKAWNWARERDKVAEPNPCSEVSRNTERARTRYVTDEEYAVVYRLAGERSPQSTRDPPAYLRPCMELAYLCRMRIEEILTARKTAVTPEGFETLRLKRSRDALTEWSDRLRAAVDMAKSSKRNIDGIWLIQDKHGQRIRYSAFHSAWVRLMTRAAAEGVEPFHFHDLKAKGVSDFEGDKQAAGGHRTPGQVKVYDRARLVVKPTR